MDESLNTTNSQITTTVKATGRLVQYEYVKTCLGVSAVRVFDSASCACAVDRDSYGFVSFTRKCLMYKGCKRASVVKATWFVRITVALCGRARLINHCQTPTRPLRINAWLSHPDWRAQPRHAERSHRTAPKHLQQTRKESRDRTCTHAQREAKSSLDASTNGIGMSSAGLRATKRIRTCQSDPKDAEQSQTPQTSTSIGTTRRKSGHHRTRHLKVRLVLDHVGDTDSWKPSIRSSNVHRA